MLVISVVMGIVPMLIYATFLWWLDRWEKEPLHLLAAAFLWGFVPSAILAIIAQLVLDIPTSAALNYNQLAYELVSGSIIAPTALTAVGIGRSRIRPRAAQRAGDLWPPSAYRLPCWPTGSACWGCSP
ncbi:MAG: hypothetical protein HY784_15965 [Chloroflexi bacterium]|nr:hypothetical protein [Chloroflexota bacterium]